MTHKACRIAVFALLVTALLAWPASGQLSTQPQVAQAGPLASTNRSEPALPPAPAVPPIPQAGTTVLFQDDFSQPNALSAWQGRFLSSDPSNMATWQLRQNALYLDEGAGGMQIVGTVDVAGQGWSDFAYGVDIFPLGNLQVGVVFRYQDGSFYRFRFLSAQYRGLPTRFLERVTGDQVVVLAQAEGPGYEAERWYNVQIAAAGSLLTVYLDGEPILQANDGELSQGQVGVYALSVGYVYFDNVRVTSLAATPPLLPAGSAPAGANQPDTSFSPPLNVSNSALPYNNTQHPRADIDASGFLHVTWMEGSDDPYPKANGPAYVKGQDSAWPAWEWAAGHGNAGYTNPDIALDSAGTVHLVWATSGSGRSPYDIYYATKAAGGSWSTPLNLSNEGDNTVYPAIAIDSQDRVWVVWQTTYSNGDTDILGRSKPAGGAWEPVQAIGYSGAQDQSPRIAVDSSNVPHVVWRNNSAGPNWEIYYSKYVSGHWTGALNVSQTSSGSHFADVVAVGGNVYVVWEDDIEAPDTFQILFSRWNGVFWSAWEYVSHSSKALYPAIAADNNNLYVVWQDYRSGSNPEVYYTHSTNSGTTWLGDENVSRNGTSSFFPAVVAQPAGPSHIFWEDMAPGQLDIFYSSGGAPAAPPYGWVDIRAHDPLNDPTYTRLLTVTLQLSATSPVGNPIANMRVCNEGACSPLPGWIPFASTIPSWPLLNTGYDCEYKWVKAWFQDSTGLQSITYTDYILYDNYVTASMSLNGGNAYTNRLTVTVNSVDLDSQQPNCSGLQALRLSQDGVSYTGWLPFTPSVEFPLSPSGPSVRTVYAQYRDRAGNTMGLSDQIALDTTPPYSATPPIMPFSTTQVVVAVSGLEAHDDESGVARVWLANRPAGPWLPMTYYLPPHDYTWDLALGGPPVQAPLTHTVYVKYEDAAGYGAYPGNFSEVKSGTILFVGTLYTTYLPLVLRSR